MGTPNIDGRIFFVFFFNSEVILLLSSLWFCSCTKVLFVCVLLKSVSTRNMSSLCNHFSYSRRSKQLPFREVNPSKHFICGWNGWNICVWFIPNQDSTVLNLIFKAQHFTCHSKSLKIRFVRFLLLVVKNQPHFWSLALDSINLNSWKLFRFPWILAMFHFYSFRCSIHSSASPLSLSLCVVKRLFLVSTVQNLLSCF